MIQLRPWRALRRQADASVSDGFLGPHSAFPFPQLTTSVNIGRLSSPEGQADDRSKFIRYARSAAQLADWRRTAILGTGRERAFVLDYGTCRYLLALVRLDDLTPMVLTDVNRREDRLRLLEATRTQLEPIMALTQDDQFDTWLNGISGELIGNFGEANVFRVDAELPEISDAYIVGAVEEYEAALNFRRQRSNLEENAPEHFALVALGSFVGQKLHPWSVGLPTIESKDFLASARRMGTLSPRTSEPLAVGDVGFRVADGRAFVLSPIRVEEHVTEDDGPEIEMLKDFGIWIGHELLVSRVWGNPVTRFYAPPSRVPMPTLDFAPISGEMLSGLAQNGLRLPSRCLSLDPAPFSGAAMFGYGDFAR
ncbi:Uncharacterised conserved protein UCP033563 [Fimbriimonadaceae bacterium]